MNSVISLGDMEWRGMAKRPLLRDVAAELARRGHLNANGVLYAAKSVAAMLAPPSPLRPSLRAAP